MILKKAKNDGDSEKQLIEKAKILLKHIIKP